MRTIDVSIGVGWSNDEDERGLMLEFRGATGKTQATNQTIHLEMKGTLTQIKGLNRPTKYRFSLLGRRLHPSNSWYCIDPRTRTRNPYIGVGGGTATLTCPLLSQLLVMLSVLMFWRVGGRKQWNLRSWTSFHKQQDHSLDFHFHLCDEGNTDPNLEPESTDQTPSFTVLEPTSRSNSWSLLGNLVQFNKQTNKQTQMILQ